MHLEIPSAIQQLSYPMHLCIVEQLQILFFGKKVEDAICSISTLYCSDLAPIFYKLHRTYLFALDTSIRSKLFYLEIQNGSKNPLLRQCFTGKK
jgi:hypothetical protein